MFNSLVKLPEVIYSQYIPVLVMNYTSKSPVNVTGVDFWMFFFNARIVVYETYSRKTEIAGDDQSSMSIVLVHNTFAITSGVVFSYC